MSKLRYFSALAVASLTFGCLPREPLPPLPRIPEACSATNKPHIVVPVGQGVRISANRPAVEPSLISIAVLIDSQFREDGRMSVPGPDAIFYPYKMNSPSFFLPNAGSSAPTQVGVSMLWSSPGAIYDRYPTYSVVCLSVDGASVSFYTKDGAELSTIVHLEFYAPRSTVQDATVRAVAKPSPETK
jgi:hypothetical protein